MIDFGKKKCVTHKRSKTLHHIKFEFVYQVSCDIVTDGHMKEMTKHLEHKMLLKFVFKLLVPC